MLRAPEEPAEYTPGRDSRGGVRSRSERRTRSSPCPVIVLAAGLAVTGCATSTLPDFEPVDFRAADHTIHLEPVGRYTGGLFDPSPSSTPHYDPATQTLFVPRSDFGQILALDIRNPSRPRLAFSIDTLEFNGLPTSIDGKDGIIAAALRRSDKTRRGAVVFFDVEGQAIGGPVRVGAQPNMLSFTPDGRRVVVANAGEASTDYTVDPKGSVSIVELVGIETCSNPERSCELRPEAETIDFKRFNSRRDDLAAAGVRIYGPNATVAEDLEPESLAISFDSRTAWVGLQRNNAIAVVDIEQAEVREILPLGSKDHSLDGNGIDASDRDDAINIRTWPIRSFYQPDIFVPYRAGGQTLLVSVNEGDPRDFDGFSESVRVRDLPLDANVFPNAEEIQENRNLGRLQVTRVDGDTDDDGDFDQIFLLGSRSFGIWTENWQLVFDSGDALEQVTAEAVPEAFNTPGNSTRFDKQSDARGPEPETLAVGEVGARTYAFVAPERIGGVYVFDITDPAAPRFQQYVNLRDFTVDPGQVCESSKPQSVECAAAGDLEPEGIVFIPASDAPNGDPLVAVVNEVSDSTTLYRIRQNP